MNNSIKVIVTGNGGNVISLTTALTASINLTASEMTKVIKVNASNEKFIQQKMQGKRRIY